MRLYEVVGFVVLLMTVSLNLFVAGTKNSPNTSTESVIVSNATSSDSKDIKNIMWKIDSQVKKVKDSLNREFYKDHYDGDILVFRYFDRGVEGQESLTTYSLYYDEQGKLIYADITHYRAAFYSIYFHNDDLLHVEVGPFLKGELFINGDMENVKAVIKKDSSYAFVLEDVSLCLEHAYR